MSSTTAAFESLYPEELYQLSSPLLVVLSKHWEELSAEEVSVLSKIIGAVKLRLEGIQLVTRPEFSIDDFAAYAPAKIVSFGARLKTPANLYELLSIQGTPVVLADALHLLDDSKKKALWQALRQMFWI